MIDPADNVTQPLPVSAPMTLRLDTPDKTIQAELLQDLIGCWMVVQSWVGKGNGRSGRKSELVDSHEAGLEVLDRLVRRYGKEISASTS